MAETNIINDTTSFDDLRAAMSGAPPVAATEPAITEPVTPVEAAPVITDVAVTEPAKTEDTKPKRFSELTRRANEWEAKASAVEARAAALEAELAQLRAVKVEPVVTPVVQATPGKPEAPNAATWTGTWDELEAARAKHVTDLVAWTVQDTRNQERVEREQQQAVERSQRANQSWQQQYDAAVEEDDAAESIVKAIGPVIGKLGVADVVKESKYAVDILKALHSDPARVEALKGMTLASAAREIGRIEAEIEAKKVVSVKKLPSPPLVVGGGATGTGRGMVIDDKTSLSDLRVAMRSVRK